MTLGETSEWSHGGVSYPLIEATSASLLEDADPTLYLALSYFAAALDLHLGGRLKAQAFNEGIVINRAVATKLGVEPTPAILADNFLFPLFALYRVSGEVKEHTTTWNKDVAIWAFAYVLPVLTPRQIVEISPILRGVEQSLAHATRQGCEPVYLGGQHIWTLARLQSIRMRDVKYEPYATIDEQNGTYRALTGTFEVVERDMPTPGAYPPFEGAGLGIDLVGADGDVLDVVEVSAFAPPTITFLAPSSGSKAGGVTLFVNGTGFRAPMTMTIGNARVDVTVLSETLGSATSPPHVAYPTLMADVTISVGPEGMSARLPAGFTFTTP